ncbi:hypothetical protein NLG97_g997 [Lecanicillium saksenae]|uniref:Uncharacterized protein n=1 Tax=Lecanicillium saksenae TaxID=468837 RepID=A0ACC1R6Q2_9HYPO|nr:hypothetical protein NLG97_g997 [Lecanicillium saksenae]
MDIRLDNFCDSKLVDFGSARTEPHCFITPANEFISDESRYGDMAQLEDVVDEIGLLVRWRTTKNIEYSRKLRSRAN